MNAHKNREKVGFFFFWMNEWMMHLGYIVLLLLYSALYNPVGDLSSFCYYFIIIIIIVSLQQVNWHYISQMHHFPLPITASCIASLLIFIDSMIIWQIHKDKSLVSSF